MITLCKNYFFLNPGRPPCLSFEPENLPPLSFPGELFFHFEPPSEDLPNERFSPEYDLFSEYGLSCDLSLSLE